MDVAGAVEAHRDVVEPGLAQRHEPLRSEGEAVGDDSPGEFAPVKLQSGLLEVGTHERLATRDYDVELMTVDVR